MRRLKILFAIILCASAVTLFLILYFRNDPGGPRFARVGSAIGGPYSGLSYGEFNSFQGESILLGLAADGTNHHSYLFDLKQHKVTGELMTRSFVECINDDASKLICVHYQPPGQAVDAGLSSMLKKFYWGRERLKKGQMNATSTSWYLDVRNNSSWYLDQKSQIGGLWSRWRASPAGHYAYGVSHDLQGFAADHGQFRTFNFDTGKLRTEPFETELCDWWDDHQIIIKDPDANFLLFDVVTQKTNMFFSNQQLNAFLKENSLPGISAYMTAFGIRNGTNYDVYFTSFDHFVLKVDKSGRGLQLIFRQCNFDLRHSASTDSSLTYYVDAGTTNNAWKPGEGGVFLHNLTNNDTRMLVAPEANVACYDPKFYCDKIIYVRDKALWQMEMSGSNKVQLFPSVEK